jgi:hypothetical protein
MKQAIIRTLSALALGAVTMKASAQPIGLTGGDPWEPAASAYVSTTPPLASTPAGFSASTLAPWFTSYLGGAQAAGEASLLKEYNHAAGERQIIAPFTGRIGTATLTSAVGNDAENIVVGSDGLLVVARTTSGGTAAGLTGGSWENTLSILYTGLDLRNPVSAGSNPDCNSATRRALALNYASAISGGSGDPITGGGTSLKHLFRRNETSAVSKLFLQLIGGSWKLNNPSSTNDATVLSGLNGGFPYCNGKDYEDRDPIRVPADRDEQVAEYDGTLGLVLPVIVPSISNNLADLYLGANNTALTGNTSPAAVGNFQYAQAWNCAGVGAPSRINPSGWDASGSHEYPGLIAGSLPNTPRCDCRYPVPTHFADPNSKDAQQFNWNVRFGAGCSATQTAGGLFGALNGDNGTSDNVPPAWGGKTPTQFAAKSDVGAKAALPNGQRCCRFGTVTATDFRREDPRLLNLFVRDKVSGNLQPTVAGQNGSQNPAIAYYRIYSTNKGYSSVGQSPFNALNTQVQSSELQIAALVENAPNGQKGNVGYGALPIYKDAVAKPAFLTLNVSPGPAPAFTPIRDRTYALSRNIFVSSLRGFQKFAAPDNSSTIAGTPVDNGSYTTFVDAANVFQAQWNLAKLIYWDTRTNNTNSVLEQKGFVALGLGRNGKGYAVKAGTDPNLPLTATPAFPTALSPAAVIELDTPAYFGTP